MKKIIVLLLLAQIGSAQETTDKAHRYLGVGYKLGVFQTSDLYSNFSPVNRLMVNVDPIKYLRFDVQWGASKTQNEQYFNTPNGQQKLTLETKKSVMQFGVFGTYEFEDMMMYLGVRYGFSNAKDDDIDFSGMSYFVVTNEEKGKILSPVLGGEYRFGNRFSVGAEISYMMINSEYDPYALGLQNTNSKLSMLETTAFFRFFPF
jgi:hypothetical protein